MKIDREHLKKKGWSDEEIHHAVSVFKKADIEKHEKLKILDQLIYWLLLFVAVIGNIAFSIAFLPVIILMPARAIYMVIGLTGIIFGTLCTTLMKDIDIIDNKHHLAYVLIIPFLGFINFILIIRQANAESVSLGLEQHNPFLLGFIYLLFFFIPYVLIYKGDKRWT